MKQVTMESVKQRISELTTTGIVSLREDFELACLRELVAVTEQRDAVVVENVALKKSEADFNKYCREECESAGDEWVDDFTETPATSAAIAALRAEGVEMFAAEMSAQHAKLQSGGYFDRQVDIYSRVSEMAASFSRQLRESKGANHE